jgi:CRP/FNR family transcriptional regulator, nitrogen oxide reductase regulator
MESTDPRRRETVLGSPLLRDLAPAVREAVLERAVPRSLERRQVLFREGDEAEAMFLVASGHLKLTQLAADGREVIVRFVGPGEPVAGITALDEGNYPVTAQAAAPAEVLLWPRRVVREICERHPRVRSNLLQTISEHMKEAMDRTRELATERVAQRLARTLLRLARGAGRPAEGGTLLDLALSRQDLAEMAGTTLFTVSRQLSQWEEEGVVETGRERVLLRSIEALEEIAEEFAAS